MRVNRSTRAGRSGAHTVMSSTGQSFGAIPTPPTPSNAYVAEDDTTYYVAEDGATYYVQES